MPQMILTSALLVLFGLILSGATCKPPILIQDHELCGDKGTLGASCFHMLSNETRKLSFDEWASARYGEICMQADAFANFKSALLKLCAETDRCTWQEVQAIEAIAKKVTKFLDSTLVSQRETSAVTGKWTGRTDYWDCHGHETDEVPCRYLFKTEEYKR